MVSLLHSLLFPLIPFVYSSVSSCPKCGTMDVPYPLSTKGSCGNPKYKIHCNKTEGLEFISSDGFHYEIININSTANRLFIMPPLIKEDTCQSLDLPVGGFRIEDDSPFYVSSRNTILLLNCSDNILLSPLNCSSNSICRQFEENESKCMDLLCCSFLKDASMTNHRIRVRVEGCTAYTSVVDMKPGAPFHLWNFGIELQWLSPF
ncbi:hypothetical protein Ccrd_020020 [Cynara cardunculus var. scolymus]|uniref:Wall-associated receptor kinase galacturonan-binding domain-containing protein n=1 Tax=Cynara cardunculus var. scolymus TaxID=59895 RepID=A0A103Y388_CYNCS|nr:hypothetical protein Ccrd_020020 [Cynara cardunculus var. scolymus]